METLYLIIMFITGEWKSWSSSVEWYEVHGFPLSTIAIFRWLLAASGTSGVTRGQTAPGDTIQGVTPEWKQIVADFTKNTGQHDVGRWELRSCDETTGKKGHHFVAMTNKKKKRSPVFLREGNSGDTVSCRPG